MALDEVTPRDKKKSNPPLRRAGFRSSKPLECLRLRLQIQLPRQLILDLATCRFLDEHDSVPIVGPGGTGKSHLAQALGHAVVRAGHHVLFLAQSQLLGSSRRHGPWAPMKGASRRWSESTCSY